MRLTYLLKFSISTNLLVSPSKSKRNDHFTFLNRNCNRTDSASLACQLSFIHRNLQLISPGPTRKGHSNPAELLPRCYKTWTLFILTKNRQGENKMKANGLTLAYLL